MMLKSYTIISKLRNDHETRPTDIDRDFRLGEGRDEAPNILHESSNLSLWSVDLKSGRVILLQISDRPKIMSAPFLYMTQYDQADRVFICNVDTFLTQINKLPELTERLALIYSVGRSGSTLLHSLINRCCDTTSLSEPDVFFKLVLSYQKGELLQREMIQLIRVFTRFLQHEFSSNSHPLVIKLRAKCIWIYSEFGKALPMASSLFIYRNAIDTVQSFDRLAGYKHGQNQWMWQVPLLRVIQRFKFRHLATRNHQLLDFYDQFLTDGSHLEIALRLGWCTAPLLDWISKIDSYLSLHHSKFRSSAVDYEDLITQPHLLMTKVFAYLALDCKNIIDIEYTMKIDSQADTPLARVNHHTYPLNRRTRNLISKIIELNTRIGSFKPKLVGTIDSHSDN